MRLLLLNPRYLAPEELKKRYDKYRGWIEKGNMYVHPFEPPLGLAYLVAYLSVRGHEAKVIDLQALDMDDAELQKTLELERPEYVGITSMTPTYPSASALAKTIKSILPDAKVIMGGVHPTILPEKVLENGNVDFVIRGEGEKALLSLMQSEPFEGIDGLCYKKDGKAVIKPKSRGFESLAELPMADYGSFPAEKYIAYNMRLRGIRGLSMLVSRGCPYRCAFCAVEGAMGRKYRLKEPAAAVDEMAALKKKFSINGVWFKDSIFNLKKDWVMEFCEELIRRGLKMSWQINTRVDLVDDEMLATMKRAGLTQVDLGIESGSQKTLDRLNKHITIEQVRRAVETVKRHVMVSGFFMIGVPGETEQDVSETFQFAKKLELDRYSFSIFVPLPGSDLYDELKAEGTISEDPDFGAMHFTDAARSYCEIPLPRLKSVFEEINNYFSSFDKTEISGTLKVNE
ncbi:MAG: radical SAM protein [Nitrospirota bacterium]